MTQLSQWATVGVPIPQPSAQVGRRVGTGDDYLVRQWQRWSSNWELTTVGDPLADLGQLLVYWAQPDDEVCALEDPPMRIDGFPTRDELVEQYLDAVGPGLTPDIDYYLAFNWWKTACIVEGVYARTLRGAMGDIDRTPASFGAQAERLTTQAWRYTQRL